MCVCARPVCRYTSRLLADAMVINGVRYRTYQSEARAAVCPAACLLACLLGPLAARPVAPGRPCPVSRHACGA